jgi:hypothetical protein
MRRVLGSSVYQRFVCLARYDMTTGLEVLITVDPGLTPAVFLEGVYDVQRGEAMQRSKV